MIDKSMRYAYRYGGHPGGGYAGSSSSSSSSSDGGGGGGGGENRDRFRAQPAPAPAPSVSPGQSMAMVGNTSLAGKTQDEAKEAVSRGEGKVDVGFQEVLRKQKIQQDLDNLEDLDDRSDLTGFDTAPKVDIRDIQGEVTDPDSGSYDKLTEVLDSPDVDEGFKRYVRQVQQPITPTPKSGIGTTLKNIALGVLAPQLLAGSKLAPLYQGYRTYQTAKRFIPKGIQETIQTAFKPKLTTGTRKTTPLVARDRDGQRVRTVAEQVATGQGLESGAKLLGVQDTQKAELFKRRSMVEDILRKGSYQNRDLTSGQRDNLRNYIEQINKFLVPVQQGI